MREWERDGVSLVSAHGGHSGQFCGHAAGTLAEIVQAYHAAGFSWAGLTDHMPPPSDAFIYDEERRDGFTAATLLDRFDAYMTECRRLQSQWAGTFELLVAFETEACSGALDLAESLIRRYRPDYVVGSVHHVHDMILDSDPESYAALVRHCGGLVGLYRDYFDLQLAMMERLRPPVLGHFDLVRLFDPGYPDRLRHPDVWTHVERNLTAARDLGLILEVNARAIKKGATEPYVSRPILERAVTMGIGLVPGDDSHAPHETGLHLDASVAAIRAAGGTTDWPRPCFRH